MTRQHYQLLIVLSLTWATNAAGDKEGIRLPDMGSSAATVISELDEREYGAALVREMHRLSHVIADPLVENYIRYLGNNLAASSDEPLRDFTFLVLKADSVNAFAAPGGVIALHSELILRADDEAEVAGVLAHEIAHVTQRHLARAVESAQRVSLPMMLLMLGVAIAGASDADVVQTAMVGGQALMAQMQINFTRANEYEADRVGIGTMARAGFDPNGMASFFGKMARISRNYGEGVPEFLRTHPVETTRIAEAKNRAANVTPSIDLQRDPLDFLLIRERIRVLTNDNAQELMDYYNRIAAAGTSGPAEAYGIALTHVASNDPVGATEALNDLAARHPRSLPIQLTMAEIEYTSDQLIAGRPRFELLVDRYPSNRAVSTAYATALLERGGKENAQRSEQLVRPLLLKHNENAALHLLYSRAADAAGYPIRAREAYAQHMFLVGRVYDAVTQLRDLLDASELSYYERSRVEARLSEIEPILAELRREDGWDPSEGREKGRRRGS